MPDILTFRGKAEFLSNFYPCAVQWRGWDFPSSEHAFQAAKAMHTRTSAECSHWWRQIHEARDAKHAKILGKQVPIPTENLAVWERDKVEIMRDILRAKFSDPALAERLLATGNGKLIEGNTWGDTFWGVCEGKGENHLGRLLMEIRSEIRTAQGR